MSVFRRFMRRKEGMAMIEFAMVAMPLIVLIVGGIQLMIVMFTQQMLETASEALSRKILTGTVQQQALTQTQFVTLACSLLPVTMNCNHLIIDVKVVGTFSSADTTRPSAATLGNPTAPTVLTYNTGASGQIVVLRLIYALPVVTLPGFNLQSNATYGLNYPMATNVFKNESFS